MKYSFSCVYIYISKVKGSHDCLKEFILPRNILPIMMQKETIENKGEKMVNIWHYYSN